MNLLLTTLFVMLLLLLEVLWPLGQWAIAPASAPALFLLPCRDFQRYFESRRRRRQFGNKFTAKRLRQ